MAIGTSTGEYYEDDVQAAITRAATPGMGKANPTPILWTNITPSDTGVSIKKDTEPGSGGELDVQSLGAPPIGPQSSTTGPKVGADVTGQPGTEGPFLTHDELSDYIRKNGHIYFSPKIDSPEGTKAMEEYIKNIPPDLEHIPDLPGKGLDTIRVKNPLVSERDLDKRTPPPLPIVPSTTAPVQPILPSNPQQPWGYPGQKLAEMDTRGKNIIDFPAGRVRGESAGGSTKGPAEVIPSYKLMEKRLDKLSPEEYWNEVKYIYQGQPPETLEKIRRQVIQERNIALENKIGTGARPSQGYQIEDPYTDAVVKQQWDKMVAESKSAATKQRYEITGEDVAKLKQSIATEIKTKAGQRLNESLIRILGEDFRKLIENNPVDLTPFRKK